MFSSRLIRRFLAGVSLAGVFSLHAWSQPGVLPDIQKPKKYENRTLSSEKSDKGKFNPVKRATQNTGTHYNYYFNGNNKINDIINRAKLSFREEYSELLPFYNYTLDNTVRQKSDLDSVIIKCNAAILLHDLRNDWIDNMYMLMGKAFFLKKNFDTAGITFQYINFYFQPRAKDEIGLQKYVGSNLNNDENVYTVSTKENRSIIDKAFTFPPSRNEALVWLIRTQIEKNQMNVAAGLIETLKRDPYFPKRLQPSLHEMQAYWYYRNEVWDSCAIHLEQALDNAENAQEKARWEYLIAQLHEKTGKKELAGEFFQRALKHTTDPVLEVFARLAEIRLTNGNDLAKIIDENVHALVKMAKRAQYENYRDVIYYTAAQMELLRDSVVAAEGFLQKSIRSNLGNSVQRNKSLFLLGNIAYDNRHYLLAYNAYDSLNLADVTLATANPNTKTIRSRKDILKEIVGLYLVITKEDSLQKVAALPEKERDAYVKAQVKRLKREKGIKESEEISVNLDNPNLRNNEVIDLFATVDTKGDWYFYNTSIKAKGYIDFRNKWGNRPNIDNWRRQAEVNNSVTITAPEEQGAPGAKSEAAGISYDDLMKNLPLSSESLQKSNDTIHSSLYQLGVIFMNKQEDYEKAIRGFEELLKRFPNTPHLEEVVFDLYYCYNKLGNTEKAALYKNWLYRSFPSGRYLHLLENPEASKEEQNKTEKESTKAYEQVYNLFIEGQFDSAFVLKNQADQQFDETHWTPQLLYIEAVYYIKQRKDSLALDKLRKITLLHPKSPMIPKVKTMISVLTRRKDIENYLTNLKVERASEDSENFVEEPPRPLQQANVPSPVTKVDTLKSVGVQPNKALPPGIKDNKVTGKLDSANLKLPPAKAPIAGFTLQMNAPHYVVILLDKVDPVYANETRTAFNRYNKEKYGSQSIESASLSLDDAHKLILMNPFPDAISAMDYVDKARKAAPLEIIPWLTTDKYSFMIISADNLETLKNSKDLNGYRKFLNGNFPGRF